MATVRFSDALRNDILNKARGLHQSRLVNASGMVVPEDIMSRVVEPKIGFIREAMTALREPEKLFHVTERASVNLNVAGISFHHDCKLSQPMIVFDKDYSSDNGEFTASASTYAGFRFRLGINVLPSDMAEVVREKVEAYKKMAEERDTFVQSVDKLINHYSTLAPALKEWPALWDLVPYEAQERHKKVVERKRKAPAKDSLDVSLDKMTGAVVAGKMQGKL